MLTSILFIRLVGVFSFSEAEEARFRAACWSQVDPCHVPAGDRVMSFTLPELHPGVDNHPVHTKAPGFAMSLTAPSIAREVQRERVCSKAVRPILKAPVEITRRGMSANNEAEA